MKTLTRAATTAALAGTILLAGSASAMATPPASINPANTQTTTSHLQPDHSESFASFNIKAVGALSNGFMTNPITGGKFVGPDGEIRTKTPFALTEDATVTPTAITGEFNFFGYGRDPFTSGTLRGSDYSYSGTLHLWDGETVTVTDLTLVPATG